MAKRLNTDRKAEMQRYLTTFPSHIHRFDYSKQNWPPPMVDYPIDFMAVLQYYVPVNRRTLTLMCKKYKIPTRYRNGRNHTNIRVLYAREVIFLQQVMYREQTRDESIEPYAPTGSSPCWFCRCTGHRSSVNSAPVSESDGGQAGGRSSQSLPEETGPPGSYPYAVLHGQGSGDRQPGSISPGGTAEGSGSHRSDDGCTRPTGIDEGDDDAHL